VADRLKLAAMLLGSIVIVVPLPVRLAQSQGWIPGWFQTVRTPPDMDSADETSSAGRAALVNRIILASWRSGASFNASSTSQASLRMRLLTGQ
jgi:hypothetical protein